MTAKKASSGQPVVSPDASVRLEGFDVRTGRTRWTFDAGHNTDLITLFRPPPQVSANTLALRDRSGRLAALGLVDGSRRRIAPTASAWCRERVEYKERDPYGGSAGATHTGQLALVPCSASGRRSATPPRVPTFVGSIGSSAAGLITWSDTHGVLARPRA